jgi:hypothetical protein
MALRNLKEGAKLFSRTLPRPIFLEVIEKKTLKTLVPLPLLSDEGGTIQFDKPIAPQALLTYEGGEVGSAEFVNMVLHIFKIVEMVFFVFEEFFKQFF